MSDDRLCGNAEATLVKFLESWKNREWTKQYQVTTLTWQARTRPIDLLRRTNCGARFLQAYRILDTHVVSDINGITPIDPEMLIDYDVDVVYELNGVELHLILTARLVRESSPCVPSKTGTWGVNPLSISRERMA